MKTIGIFGGGQLGSMLTQSIFKLGGNVCIYDESKNSVCSRQVAKFYQGSYHDETNLQEFNSNCDILTYEFENIPYTTVSKFSDKTIPNSNILKICQNRIYEKQFLQNHNLPIVRHIIIENEHELEEQLRAFSFPLILKSAKGGYDGKSQYIFNSEAEFKLLATQIINNPRFFPAVAEEKISLSKEVSCIIAQTQDGNIINFPIIENVHHDNILEYSICPARINTELSKTIIQYSTQIVKAFNLIGLIVIEFFLSTNSPKSDLSIDNTHIFINEIAPRPHNSGHLTIKACNLSQFDVLARILLNMPCNQPELILSGSICMINIFGESFLNNPNGNLNFQNCALSKNLIDLNIYGKTQAKLGRKMGHLTVNHIDAMSAIELAKISKASLSS